MSLNVLLKGSGSAVACTVSVRSLRQERIPVFLCFKGGEKCSNTSVSFHLGEQKQGHQHGYHSATIFLLCRGQGFIKGASLSQCFSEKQDNSTIVFKTDPLHNTSISLGCSCCQSMKFINI